MAEPLLKMVGVKKSFPGVQALKGVDFEAYAGEALALIGANGAGKSTLMNVLGGVLRPDEGEIQISGKTVEINNPLDAAECGIAFVHQEMAMLPTMSIADTMFVANYITRAGIIDYQKTRERCVQALKRLGCNFDPFTRIRDLSPGDQQMVEIARALLTEPQIIIFDEPTSSLTSREKARLFEVINGLKGEGVTVIYITHLMDEVFRICERAQVLRNGETVGGGLIKDLTYEDIVKLMIGTKEINRYFERHAAAIGEIVLKVESLSRKGVLENISFELRQGEVVGLWGLLGSGRTEVARAVVGLDPLDGGVIQVRTNGDLKKIVPSEAKNWIGMVTENRREEGLLLPMSVKKNLSLANLRALAGRWYPFINFNLETAQSKKFVDRLGIMVSSLDQRVSTLSGGNQQKVVVGRWLQRNPIIFFMDEPTRGLDVGAKADIRSIIGELAAEGAALLVISSDIDEIMSLGDRFLVMHRGRMVKELSTGATKEELMTAAAGV